MKPLALLIPGVLLLSGCDREAGDYPRLLPTDVVLAEPVLPAHVPAEVTPAAVRTDAASRAEALRRRADALRGPVIEPDVMSRIRREN